MILKYKPQKPYDMKPYYLCPHCFSVLNIQDDVALKFEKPNGIKGIVFLHSEVGNYQARINDSVDFEESEKVDFYCPVCSESLGAREHDNLAKLVMKDLEGEHTIVFSKIYGEKCTYKITEGGIEKFGEHSDVYIDFDNLTFMK